jgi:EAL domain-containing protein (putative c-di-GMP-specific phosphodiesterase class I)/GGDEF domain-containing protein
MGSSPVRSTRLSPDADVRNKLFPKTRSWFALDAPLELLSPLSVFRIICALELICWPLAAVSVGHASSFWVVGLVVLSVAVEWVVLTFVHGIGVTWSKILLTLSTAQIAVLAYNGHGTGLSFVYMLFLVPLGVAVGLFLNLRSTVAQLVISLVFMAGAMEHFLGAARDAGFVAVLGIGTLSSSPAVWFLTSTAKRKGTFDPDTGLPNGAGLARRVQRRIEEPMVIVAVTRLEGILDAREALGHEVGTELLRRAVEDIGQVLPSGAFVGRVDGDELVVIAGVRSPVGPTTELEAQEHAFELAKTLNGAVSAGRYLVGEIEVLLRTHVGLAIAASDDTDVAELVRRASVTARRAASTGQAHLVWEGNFGAMTADDLALLADLRLAAQRGELALAYQPQIRATSRRMESVEALLRWTSPIYGSVPPSRFIPLAERTGLIDPLTEWVLAEALDAQVRWRALGYNFPVSVNLSPTSLTTPELPNRILAELATRELPSRCLTVEVTETAAVDLLQAVGLLRPLHDRGVRIAIDDFGTGYTSLAVLPDLPLNELKVDQRFVLRSTSSAADDAIVQTVLGLAHRLGLDAVAEGVETKELADRMTGYGFDFLQGFHLARPLDESALLTFADRNLSMSTLTDVLDSNMQTRKALAE